MTRYLDDRCLANFVAIFEARNLKHAADKVGMTQPAMSKSLSRLENDVGIRLFERKNRGLDPTPAAHELFDCAKKIEAQTRKSFVRMSGLNSGLTGTIRIGAGHMWSWLRMPHVIHEFLQQFPNIEIDLVTAPMKLLVDELAAGNIDLAVGEIADTQVPKDYQEHRFTPGLQWPYVRRDHPLAQKQDVSFTDLVAYPWTGFFDNSVFQNSIAAACEASGVSPPSIPLRSTSLVSLMSIASKGDYVIVLPDDFGATAANFGLARVSSQSLKMWGLETSVVYSLEEYTNGPIKNLIDLMIETTKGSNIS